MSHTHPDAVFTLPELAAALKCSDETVRRLILEGKLRAFKVRGSYRIAAAAIAEYLSASGAHESDAYALLSKGPR